MTRYFFDVDDGSTIDLDTEGREFSSDASVKAAAARMLVDLIQSVGIPDADQQLRIVVRDESGVIGRIGTAGLGYKLEQLAQLLRSKAPATSDLSAVAELDRHQQQTTSGADGRE